MNFIKALPRNLHSKEIKKIIKQAVEVYEEIDEIREKEEDTFLEVLNKIPMNHIIDSEPEVNPVKYFHIKTSNLNSKILFHFQNGSDKDEVEKMDASKTITKIAWKVAKAALKKAVDMFD